MVASEAPQLLYHGIMSNGLTGMAAARQHQQVTSFTQMEVGPATQACLRSKLASFVRAYIVHVCQAPLQGRCSARLTSRMPAFPAPSRDELRSCNVATTCPAELEASSTTMEGGLPPGSSNEMTQLFTCVVAVLQSETVGSGSIGG